MSEPCGYRVGIVGAGRMGQGIARAFGFAGVPVVLIDSRYRTEAAARTAQQRASSEIARQFHAAVAMRRMTPEQADSSKARIRMVSREAGEAELGGMTVVFEAVPEVLSVKAELLAWIGDAAGASTLVASTTSGFRVTELAPLISAPARFVNAHWLNPADLMPLVEISRGPETDDAVVAALVHLFKDVGKVPVVCSASAGYIVPRIQTLAMNEAARMVEEGVASAEDIDTAVRVGFGLRFAVLGLLEFIDWGGGDILHYVSRHLTYELGDRFAAPELIGQNMISERTGLRNGRGFYVYDADRTTAYQDKKMQELAGLLDYLGLVPQHNSAVHGAPL